MDAAASITPGIIVSFRFPTGDCRLVEVDALGRLWFERLWNGERTMEPAGPFQALVRMGHAVVRSTDESAAIELEYEQARQRRAAS